LINKWSGGPEIKEKTKYQITSIHQVCRGERKTAHGFKWEFAA
jgi:hypothetical protein